MIIYEMHSALRAAAGPLPRPVAGEARVGPLAQAAAPVGLGWGGGRSNGNHQLPDVLLQEA